MNEFSIGGAWSLGFQFVSRGTAVHFLILVLVGIAAPLGLQYAVIGAPFDASPMSGQAMMRSGDAPLFLLAVALTHILQAGSYVGALRFGFTGAQEPAGATGFGLAAGFVATLVVALGYAVAIFGAPAVGDATRSIELATFVLMLPLVIVYGLFFISQALMAAAAIVISLVYVFIMATASGYPISLVFAGGGGLIVVMLLMSALLFWLAARFSCVTAVMARRGSPNVFEAIGESWRMTADEQWAITRYLALIGFGVGLVVFVISLALNSSTGGLGQGSNFGLGSTGGLVLRLLFAIPLAFLSVIIPAGIYRQLTGEETDVEVFE